MKLRLLLIGSCLAVLCGLIFLAVRHGEDAAEAASLEPSAHAQGPDSISHENSATLLRSALVLEPPAAIPDAKDDADAISRAWEAANVPRPDSPLFAEKYQGATQTELEIAAATLGLRCRDMMRSIAKERIKDGLSNAITPVKNEPHLITDQALATAGDRIPRPAQQPTASFLTGTGRSANQDLVHIPYGVYPEFDTLGAELGWLQGAIKNKKR